jgi:hypothetical protein
MKSAGAAGDHLWVVGCSRQSPSRSKLFAMSRRFLWMIGLTMWLGVVAVDLDNIFAKVGLHGFDAHRSRGGH